MDQQREEVPVELGKCVLDMCYNSHNVNSPEQPRLDPVSTCAQLSGQP